MLGCCCKCDPLSADVWENITKVRPYDGSADGIAPYSRPWRVFDGAGVCSLASSPTSTCGGAGQPVCYNYGFDRVALAYVGRISGVDACAGAGGDMVDSVIDNCFKKTAAKVSFPRASPHCGMGYKNVGAEAAWPGRFGFIDSGGACCNTGGQTQSKYTTVAHKEEVTFTISASGSGSAGPPTSGEFSYSHSFNQTATVGSEGNITRSGGMSASYDDAGNFFGEGTYSDDCDPASGHAGLYYFSQMAEPGFYTVPASGTFKDTFPVAVQHGPLQMSASCGIIYANDVGPGGSDVSGTAAELNAMKLFDAGASYEVWHASSVNPGVDPDLLGTKVIVSSADNGTFSVNDDVLKLTYSGSVVRTIYTHDSSDVLTYTYVQTIGWDYSVEIRLSGSLTYASVLDSCKALLEEWQLADDKQYQWRTDGATWLMPYVTRDEGSTEPSIDWAIRQPIPPSAPGDAELDCRFNDFIYYTGEIRGAPMPPGYDKFFNFYHINWARQSTGSTCSACEMSLGAWSDDFAGLPATATQWTDYERGSSICGPGAHVQNIIEWNYTNGSVTTTIEGVRMVKWAETIEQWPALNAARPCGHDAWTRNETETFCVASFDGTALELVDPGVLAGTVGMSSGIYSVVSGSGTSYVLTKLYDLNPDITDYVDVKTMRHPSARSICGALTATAVQTSPGVITVTVTRKHWLHVGSSVNFTGIGGLGSGVAVVTVPTNLTFTVAGTLTSPLAGTVSQTGADVVHDTTCSKKKFIARTWRSQYRENFVDGGVPTYSQTAELLDYAYSPSKPYVACCSPNAEGFESGVIYDFVDIAADQCFGEEWHMRFEQAVTDPNWQAKTDCVGVQVEDSAPCANDHDYGYHPLVEAYDIVTAAVMPYAVGTPICENVPRSHPTVHTIRAAWLLCHDWEDFANKNCVTQPKYTNTDPALLNTDPFAINT